MPWGNSSTAEITPVKLDVSSVMVNPTRALSCGMTDILAELGTPNGRPMRFLAFSSVSMPLSLMSSLVLLTSVIQKGTPLPSMMTNR